MYFSRKSTLKVKCECPVDLGFYFEFRNSPTDNWEWHTPTILLQVEDRWGIRSTRSSITIYKVPDQHWVHEILSTFLQN